MPSVEPGKFNYRLVRAELEFADYGSVEAHCRIDGGRDDRALHPPASGRLRCRFAAAMSEHPIATHAMGEVVGQVVEALGEAPDLAVLFVTAPTGRARGHRRRRREMLQPTTLFGTTAVSVVGGDREVEEQPAISSGPPVSPRPSSRCASIRARRRAVGARWPARGGRRHDASHARARRRSLHDPDRQLPRGHPRRPATAGHRRSRVRRPRSRWQPARARRRGLHRRRRGRAAVPRGDDAAPSCRRDAVRSGTR